MDSNRRYVDSLAALGDLFMVRNAGHIVDDAVLGSIEYAVGHLGVSLVVVMGHSSCGAVKANISRAVATLHQARPILGPKVARRELLVTGTHYELNTGAVTAI